MGVGRGKVRGRADLHGVNRRVSREINSDYSKGDGSKVIAPTGATLNKNHSLTHQIIT